MTSTTRRRPTGLLCAFALLVAACGSRSNAASDDEVVPECASYLSALRNCTQHLGPDLTRERTAVTRDAFIATAKDDAARERLAARCRAAHDQISRACR